MWPYRRRSSRQVLADLQFALRPVARPNPLVIMWRWRYELGLVTGLPAAMIILGRAVGAVWAVVILAALAHLIVLWPAARRLLVAQAWCVITAHRVRTGCAQAWIHSRNGKIPVVLITSRRPYGQSVWLWCRAGTSAEDFVVARRHLAAACWARAVYVTPDARFAHLVTLHVVRHPDWPLPEDPDGPGNGLAGPQTPPEPPAAGRRPWRLMARHGHHRLRGVTSGYYAAARVERDAQASSATSTAARPGHPAG